MAGGTKENIMMHHNMFKHSDRFVVDFSLKHFIKSAAYKDSFACLIYFKSSNDFMVQFSLAKLAELLANLSLSISQNYHRELSHGLALISQCLVLTCPG